MSSLPPSSGRPAPPAPLTFSAEVFAIPLQEDRFLVYAPLRKAAFVANGRTVNVLAALHSGESGGATGDNAIIVEMARRFEIVDGGDEPPPLTVFTGDPEPTEVTLFLTTACNLRCTYCYAAAGDTPRRAMSLEVATKGIDFVLKNAIKKQASQISVAYHGGGEPTVNWTVLSESLVYAKQKAAERGIAVSSAAATNGVLPSARLEWIIENMSALSVSFDGLPSAQDRHRITVGGGGSSAHVIRTLHRLDEADFPYGVRVTVTRDQIAALPDSVDFICTHFSVDRIQVEPAYQMGRWRHAPSAETESFIAAYREAQRRANRLGREISFSGARLGLLSNHFCGVTQDNFCLSPDGNVSSCYEVFSEDNPLASRFFYGESTNEGYAFNLQTLNALRAQAVQNRPYCAGCFAKWSCGGDCYHKSMTVNGKDEFEGTDRCHIIRELTKDQILERIVASGGLFWHEPPAVEGDSPAAGKEMLL